jgi:hypothetical protein
VTNGCLNENNSLDVEGKGEIQQIETAGPAKH